MKYNPKLRRSIRSTKAYNNKTFLNSREARGIRIQCEVTEPAVRLHRLGIDHTIQFFGSARTKPGERFYTEAEQLAGMLGTWSCNEQESRIGISSGGGPGTMEAVNKGAQESGAPSVGMGISLPFEQRNNEYISPDLDFEFHYFFTRKYWCVYPAKAYIALPGGVGTMDELFEVMTLIQTQKLKRKLPIVLYGKDFWQSVINFDKLIEYKTISPEDVNLFKICDTPDEAFEYITANIQLSE